MEINDEEIMIEIKNEKNGTQPLGMVSEPSLAYSASIEEINIDPHAISKISKKWFQNLPKSYEKVIKTVDTYDKNKFKLYDDKKYQKPLFKPMHKSEYI